MEREEWVPMTSADATEIIGPTIFVVPLLFRKGSLRSFDLKARKRSDMMKNFSSSAF
jgi:exonuclease SbcC